MQSPSPEPTAPPPALLSRWSRFGASWAAREKVERTLLVVDRARGQMLAYVRRSQLVSWPSRRVSPDELLMAPPDLRVPDPSFLDELRFGNFGLAGEIADLRGQSPFACAPASEDWARELHGFGWLRNLDAERSVGSEMLARRLVQDWLHAGCRDKHRAWAAEATGRRLISWLSHSALLLDGAEPKFYAAVIGSLQRQTSYLSAAWQQAAEGYGRLVALTGLVLADVCIAGRERQLNRSGKLLAAEIERQILPDGGHVSRNPETLIELLLDLLPLRQCFLGRGLPPCDALIAALGRMGPMLRHLRLGDGSLARFNGVGATDRDALATVLAYDKGEAPLPAMAAASGYARLARAQSIVVVDVGPPPPLSLAHNAHAGCLAFELSVEGEPLFVNNSRPGRSEAGLRAAARATASHNTLCLKEQSSSKLIRRGSAHGALSIAHPDRVTCSVADTDTGLLLEASHDGYVGRWGLVHARELQLDADGKLKGSDCLLPAKGVLRFAWDVPFAIHFHVHPDVEVWPGRDPDTADLVLKSGQRWRLAATGAALTVEPSVHSGGASGPRPAQQLVLRAACHGEAKVAWEVARMPPAQQPEPATQAATALAPSLAERLAGADGNAAAAPERPARR